MLYASCKYRSYTPLIRLCHMDIERSWLKVDCRNCSLIPVVEVPPPPFSVALYCLLRQGQRGLLAHHSFDSMPHHRSLPYLSRAVLFILEENELAWFQETT